MVTDRLFKLECLEALCVCDRLLEVAGDGSGICRTGLHRQKSDASF